MASDLPQNELKTIQMNRYEIIVLELLGTMSQNTGDTDVAAVCFEKIILEIHLSYSGAAKRISSRD